MKAGFFYATNPREIMTTTPSTLELATLAASSVAKGTNWDWLDIPGWEYDDAHPSNAQALPTVDGKKLRLATYFSPLDPAQPYSLEVLIYAPMPRDFDAEDFHIDDYDWTVESARVLPA